MKRTITFATMAVCMVASCNKFDDSAIWDKLNNHDNRIAYLEEVCKKMNTDIINLQTIVTALETNDYIVNASPLITGDGYTFFFKSGKSILIYNGKDGVDGTDGKNGVTPTISVMKDVDGIYYWTINNEWLIVNGEKVKAAASDGKNGVNGTDGKDGKDGVSPKFKIEEEYWFISYDDGKTWEKLGKATGSNGLDGINGEDGDNIFQQVTQDHEYVHFYLIDGTMITLTKYDPINIQFEDLNVKAICCKNWDTNFDGELSYSEAAAVNKLSGFYNNNNIIAFTELRYFTNLSEIPSSAFHYCSSLWKISLPTNLRSIGGSAFSECTSLSTVVVPDGVISIGSSAFYKCSSMKSIYFPPSITTFNINNDGSSITSFMDCTGKVAIDCDIPEGTFRKAGFEEVIIGDSVETIGKMGFDNCSKLEKVTIGENLKMIDDYAFSSCKSLTDINIPDNVETIGVGSFSSCSKLANIKIGKGIKTICEKAFLMESNNNKLNEVYINNPVPPAIGSYAFHEYYIYNSTRNYKMPTNLTIYVPRAAVSTYKSAWSTYANKIVGYDF